MGNILQKKLNISKSIIDRKAKSNRLNAFSIHTNKWEEQ